MAEVLEDFVDAADHVGNLGEENLTADASSIKTRLHSGELTLNRVGKRSFIWEHFGRIFDPAKGVELDYYACKKCNHPYKVDKSGGTGKFESHLAKFHKLSRPKLLDASSQIDSKQSKLESHFSKSTISKLHGEKITDCLLKHCIDRCLPFDEINSDSMKDIIYAVLQIDHLSRADQEKVFKFLDESTIRKVRLPKKFEEIMGKIKENIKRDSSGSGGVTVDFWSDQYRHREYFALTFHFLDNEFNFHVYCLACRQVTEPKITAVIITRLIRSILAQFDLDPSNMVFVTDSGANVKAVFDQTGWSRIACFAHDLNLLVSSDGFGPSSTTPESSSLKAVPQITELISHCKALVNHFKRGSGQRR